MMMAEGGLADLKVYIFDASRTVRIVQYILPAGKILNLPHLQCIVWATARPVHQCAIDLPIYFCLQRISALSGQWG